MDGVGGVVHTTRAMEVLQASGPGARMRVTRAAYHSSGPLSTSYLLHSSTRTILSSGAEVLLSPSLVSKPLELSSTPLDAASDSCAEGEEPYKVTEPDDTDISEPSKWRSSLGRRSLRMPSEESSSTDNASLIDSGGRTYFPTSGRRTHSDFNTTIDSPSQATRDVEPKSLRSSFHRKPSSEPLMKISEHAKCLESSISKLHINKSGDEWHDRRNSYGFENSPPNDIKKLSENDKIGMESSTDSGICKSTEVVNIPIEKYQPYDNGEYDDVERNVHDRQESFQDWLVKKRSSSSPKPDFSSVGRRNIRDNRVIDFKSPGKISIALPVGPHRNIDDSRENKHNVLRGNFENSDRKLKKVEFCKTELHFTAESGKVKIIETDEKPPSTNDFRRRRSAFVPIKDQIERPITLFGGTYLDENSIIEQNYVCNDENGDIVDQVKNSQDSDSAVKSILKNKIPKPKPYLLGEDIEFDKGRSSEDNIWGVRLRRTSDEFLGKNTTKSPISILNESLKQDNRSVMRQIHEIDQQFNKTVIERNNERDNSNNISRVWKSDPVDYVNLNDFHKVDQPLKSVASTQTTEDLIYDMANTAHRRSVIEETQIKDIKDTPLSDSNSTNFVHEKLKLLQLSPILQNRAKTRHLRQNELSYFGVTTDNTAITKSSKTKARIAHEKPVETVAKRDKSFRKGFEVPLYQNLPVMIPSAPVPAPRSSSSKLEQKVNESKELVSKIMEKYSSDESVNNNNLSDGDERELSTGGRRAKRVLETINELKIASQETTRKGGSNNKDSKPETKRKSSRSSPNVVRVEATSRRSMNKTSSNESLVRSRESSFEDTGRTVVKPRRYKIDKHGNNKSTKVEKEPTSSTRSKGKLKEEIKYTAPEQKIKECIIISPKANDSLSKTRSRSTPVCTKDTRLQQKHDKDKTSHPIKESEDGTRSPSTERLKLIHGSNAHEKIGKGISQNKHNERSAKERSRKKEYILNYDDKNGTLSSVSKGQAKHSNSRKYDIIGSVRETMEEKPKQITRTSRVTTLEVKNPMLSTKERHRRTKSTDHKSPRRKPREEPSH